MANTFELIATVTLASNQATIDFTSIPQTFTDICVKLSGRSTSGGNASIYVRPNGSATSVTERNIYGNGTSAISNSSTGFAWTDGASQTANTFSSSEIYFPNYTGATNKSYSMDSVQENNGTDGQNALVAGLKSNTAALTSITLATDGSWVTYSTAYLYGVKNA